jgi:stress-induced morphogen
MDRVARSKYYRQHLTGLTPLQRHQQLVSHALQQQLPGGFAALQTTETDYDALRKHHR